MSVSQEQFVSFKGLAENIQIFDRYFLVSNMTNGKNKIF